MTAHFTEIARQAATDGQIDAGEILELRRAGWADGRMTLFEAEAIFAAQRANREPSAEWSDFFVEAIRNYVLDGSAPRGYASEDEAQWLIEQVRRDGRVCSMTELELLTGIIERAQNVPVALKDYVLETLETAVLQGTGPTRDGGELSDTHVTEAECRLIRRIIFGSASERPAAVGKREAEMLFRIKDATEPAANSPEFVRLFVQGVGNYLMGFSFANGQIDRERALELEAFVADNKASIGGFMGRMAIATPNVFGAVFGKRPGADASLDDRVAAEAQVDFVEKEWLDAQISLNGKVDAYDRALLDFLAEEVGRD